MRHHRTAIILVVGAALMLGLAYASVPLYRLFCTATGYGGTPQRAAAAVIPETTAERWVTVSFDSNVATDLPWEFGPDQPNIRVKVGDIALVFYHVSNHGSVPITGSASFNVQPDKAGRYFEKVQCFCFSRQTLTPGQSVQLPVQFYIDPALDKSVADITLSYTFFRAKETGS